MKDIAAPEAPELVEAPVTCFADGLPQSTYPVACRSAQDVATGHVPSCERTKSTGHRLHPAGIRVPAVAETALRSWRDRGSLGSAVGPWTASSGRLRSALPGGLVRRVRVRRWLLAIVVGAVLAGAAAFSAPSEAIGASGRPHGSHRCFDIRELHICVHGGRKSPAPVGDSNGKGRAKTVP